MEIQYKRLSEITPYDKNAKTHDQTQINNVAESIRQYGFAQPIVIDRDGVTNESPWDFDLLVPELDGLDLDCFDFDWGIPIEDNAEVQEDDAPEVDETQPPVTKLGDVWQLGRHRLMCGDSTSMECVQTLMGGGTGRPPAYRPTIRC